MSEPPNTAHAAYWTDVAGPTWAALQGPLDRQLEPLGRRAMAALAPASGEFILDVGCGAGATTLDLARAVGPGGRVIGVDISATLLTAARTRLADEPVLSAEVIEADAQIHAFEPAAFDAIFSRFGVMFFASPEAAFANLRRALKPEGRLAFVCWRGPEESPVMTLPMRAAAALVEPPPPAPPGAPGPFAFADPARIERILGEAGFTGIKITPHDEMVSAGDLETVLGLSLRVGPLGGLLREHPDRRDAVIEAVRTALSAHAGPRGVELGAGVWIVSAQA